MADQQLTQCEPLLVVILGPTASGKTSLGLHLALQFSGEIVSCDSVALYRYFDVGTAKPLPEERSQVPHHLLDIADPGQPFTAGEYARRARAALHDISSRGHLPIVVGGTGLYLRALLDGLFPGPERSEELRQRLRTRGSERGSTYLHRLLKKLDPGAATEIHANDAPKIIRAIEVCLAASAPMSELWRQRGRDPLLGYRILRIGLNPPRDLLYQRINQRAESMFARGLVEETRDLVSRFGEGADITPLHSLGYKQALQFIKQEISLEQAITAAKQGHRNYAKRQMTWFRRERDVTWIEAFGEDAAAQQQAVSLVTSYLRKT